MKQRLSIVTRPDCIHLNRYRPSSQVNSLEFSQGKWNVRESNIVQSLVQSLVQNNNILIIFQLYLANI